jgi:hypothetical protein
MSVIRVNKSRDFTTMSNHHLRNKELSLKAKGLLSVMLSLPVEWDYSISGLCAICKENETAIKTALGELKTQGYVIVHKKNPNRDENRSRYEYIYDIYEVPQEKKEEPNSQEGDFLPLEILALENQGQLNTNISNTDRVNSNISPLSNNNTIHTSTTTTVNTNAFLDKKDNAFSSEKGNRIRRGESKPKCLDMKYVKNIAEEYYDNQWVENYEDKADEFTEIVNYFCERYKHFYGKTHKHLKPEVIENLAYKYLNPIELLDVDIGFEDYKVMIDKYFATEYNKQGGFDGKIDKTLCHFWNDTIINRLFYRTCY